MDWLEQLLDEAKAGHPLELAEYEGIQCRPCLQCGFCCKQTHCGFGSWDAEKKQCTKLIDNGDGTYGCSRYEEIIAMDPSRWAVAPAFGAGCCAPINEDRERLRQED
jgi:hypothetical protein